MSVREAMHGYHSGVDLALDDEGFVVPTEAFFISAQETCVDFGACRALSELLAGSGRTDARGTLQLRGGAAGRGRLS